MEAQNIKNIIYEELQIPQEIKVGVMTVNLNDLEKIVDKISNRLEKLVSEKFAGTVDSDTFKEVAEFVELEINEKHSNYWSNIAMGNASARFWHAYKKYISKFSR